MHLIDLRNGKIVNHYKGAAGSITAIAINKKSTNVVSVSLDRVLRIHDIKTKELLKKVSLILINFYFSTKKVMSLKM